MKNAQDIIKVLEFNNFNKDSSLESVNDALNYLGCDEGLKKEVVLSLAAMGWFGVINSEVVKDVGIASAPEVVDVALIPAEEVPVVEMPVEESVQNVPEIGNESLVSEITINPSIEEVNIRSVEDEVNLVEEKKEVFDIQGRDNFIVTENLSSIVEVTNSLTSMQEVINALRAKGCDEHSSLDSVNVHLSQINCSDYLKKEVIVELMKRGWFQTIKPSQVQQAMSQDNHFSSVESVVDQEMSKIDPINQEAILPKKRSRKGGLILIILGIFILLVAGIIYAYTQKIGPFSFFVYKEENFLSSLLEGVDEINSASFKLSGEIKVVPREEGVMAFTIEDSLNTSEMRDKYNNDLFRIEAVNDIVNDLEAYYYGQAHFSKHGKYPESLKELALAEGGYWDNSIIDPVTLKEYGYRVTDNGNNFSLEVDFETEYVNKALRLYFKYNEEGYVVDGMKISFNKNADYVYMSSETPKTFFENLVEGMKAMPKDYNTNGSLAFAFENGGNGLEWEFSEDASISSGTYAYQISGSALKKDKTYYFKIDDFPMTSNSISSIKGQWMSMIEKERDEDEEEDEYYYQENIGGAISFYEKNIVDNIDTVLKIVKIMASIADEKGLITFASNPRIEKVDGRDLVRYDLEINREAISLTYIDSIDQLKNDSKLGEIINSSPLYLGQMDEEIRYQLESKEFADIFDYLSQNNSLVIWTDTKGVPVAIENVLKVAPPESVKSFRDKQVNISIRAVIDGINEPLEIITPEDSRPFEEVMKEVEGDDYGSNWAYDSKIKATMDQMRAGAELCRVKSNSNYSCILTDEHMNELMDDLQGKLFPSNPTDKWCYVKEISDGRRWCADSNGYVGTTAGRFCSEFFYSCR